MEARTAYSKTMREKADALVAISDKWALGNRHSDGRRFILFASCSRPDIFYMTRIDGEGCTCPAARLSKRARCFHQLAAATVYDRAREQTMAPKPRPTYDELMDHHLVDAF